MVTGVTVPLDTGVTEPWLRLLMLLLHMIKDKSIKKFKKLRC